MAGKYNNYNGGCNRHRGGHTKEGADRRGGFNSSKYVGAPYNFVSQWEKVVERNREDCIAHNSLSDDLVSGEISYRFTAETEVSVGGNGEDFYRDEYGRTAIPGSSVRGMMRSNAQILSLSSIADDVDDYFLMFREVGGKSTNPNKKPYETILGSGTVPIGQSTISVLKNVKAGYLVKEGKGYKIYQTRVDKINNTLGKINYYILNEMTIAKDRSHDKYPFFWKNPQYTQHVLSKGFRTDMRNGRVHNKGETNYGYNPYYAPVSYRIHGERAVEYVGEPGKGEGIPGVALGTGKMNEKKCQYIIPQIDKNKPSISLKEDDIKAFQIDYQHKLNQLKGMFRGGAKFFDLPKTGEEKPVFYIESEKRVYFGFTPRLRLFYKHPVKHGLSQSQRETRIDYAKSLFGFSVRDDSYKTRISFSDAVAVSERAGYKRQAILGEPSLSSYNDYLTTDKNGNATTYNMDGFRLRGVKQYWLRSEVDKPDGGKNDKVASTFTTLGEGSIFEGKVRFHNLTPAELGLILWCLKLNPSSRQQIGKGKPLGYGRIKPEITAMTLLDPKKAYSNNCFTLSPLRDIGMSEIDEYVSLYKKEINAVINMLGVGSSIDTLESIKEFFAMKDSEHLADPRAIRYMSIDGKDYQNRAPLAYVSGVKRKQ